MAQPPCPKMPPCMTVLMLALVAAMGGDQMARAHGHATLSSIGQPLTEKAGSPRSTTSPTVVDVLIVGAGMAGMCGM